MTVGKNQQLILPGDRTLIFRFFTKRNTTTGISNPEAVIRLPIPQDRGWSG
ncbi:MAG: hypothetical protein RSE13_18250 [Planktothrix sp. GU0601_MAG3]|nr:MAG: hypothetical protein RSE13_18250 [Planktothrix sp. GU0601_MAG3]